MSLQLTSPKLSPNYQPTVEDLLAIEEFLQEEREATDRAQRERDIADTDTRDERRPIQSIAWDPEPSLAEKVAALIGRTV